MEKEMLQVYFASPWFNEEQAEREERVKSKLRDLGFDVWSPKENCVCPPDASNDVRKQVFIDNCKGIEQSQILFAITDGKDMGTIWEAGYAAGLNELHNDKIIIYYCETIGERGQFNLMLAQSGDIIVTKFEDLDKIPELIKEGKKLEYVGEIE